MSGGDPFGAELAGTLGEGAELEVLVAHDAGVGSAAGAVFLSEVTDDLGLEVAGFINQVEGDAEPMADRAGIGNGLWAAAFVLGAGHAVLRPEFESDANDFETLLQEQGSSSGGVHTAGHSEYDTFFG